MAHTVFFANEDYDGQFGRTLAAASAGTADIGEAFAAAEQIGKRPNPDHWYAVWNALGTRVHAAADAAAAQHPVSARNAYLRACEYYRQAFFFLRHDLDDQRLQGAYANHVAAFKAAATNLGGPVATELNIPFEAIAMHGWFIAPDASGEARPTVIMPCGYDSTAETTYTLGTGALRRGYNLVAFDGPGQGRTLYVDRVVMRRDFEVALTPVVDLLLTRADVDAERIALIGRSFAGYLAPRAAAFEHRIAALVCDPPNPNLGSRIPTGITGELAAPVISLESKFSVDKREFFGARMATHGVHNLNDYFASLRTFNMLDVAKDIRCPTLLVACEGDPLADIGGSEILANGIGAQTTEISLSAATGAGGHCGGLGQHVWDAAVYDWLDATLR